tara:strand:+ start:498 stop:674 length:177 start_codon:yes stop_codon:yes gene_type:complete
MINNNFEALIEALKLAITAPNEKKAQEVIALAEHFSLGMDELTIQKAKKIVLEKLQEK